MADEEESHRWDPNYICCPGEILQEWIDEMKADTQEVAQACHIYLSDFRQILDGKKVITDTIAEGLYQGTGISPGMWINLEKSYRAGLAAGKVHTHG